MFGRVASLRPRVVALDGSALALGEDAWESLAKLGDLQLHDNTPHDDVEAIVERCRGAEVLVTSKVPITSQVLSQLPCLELVQVVATGYNMVDVSAASARGVTVCNVPTYGTGGTAQHTVALVLELCNRVGLHDASVKAGDWAKASQLSHSKSDIVELEGLTVGLLGMGAIGKRTGEMLRAFGVGRVVAWTPSKRGAPNWPEFEWADSVQELFEQSDVLSLHCPMSADTKGIVNAANLAFMKPSAFLVNTARGGLVDEQALADALVAGRLAGAAVDVVVEEPMNEMRPSPLLRAPNCVITPHIASKSEKSRKRMLQQAVANVERFLSGAPVDAVPAGRPLSRAPELEGVEKRTTALPHFHMSMAAGTLNRASHVVTV